MLVGHVVKAVEPFGMYQTDGSAETNIRLDGPNDRAQTFCQLDCGFTVITIPQPFRQLCFSCLSMKGFRFGQVASPFFKSLIAGDRMAGWETSG